MTDVHIRDKDHPPLDRLLGQYLHKGLCGKEVFDWEIGNPTQESIFYDDWSPDAWVQKEFVNQPTCMGCLLIHLQNKAEASNDDS